MVLYGGQGKADSQRDIGGENGPQPIVGIGGREVKALPGGLADALRGHPTPTHISRLKLYWEPVELLDRQIADLDRLVAQALKPYQEAVGRLGK